MPNIDVVIVNWNAGTLLQQCLNSLAAVWRAQPGLLGLVTVVDNGSTDGSLDLADECELPKKIIRNGENLGFAAACNRGARAGHAPYILFLNPDATASFNALHASLDFMESPGNERVAISGVRLVDDSGAVACSCARFPSPGIFLSRTLGLNRVFPDRFKDYHMVDWDHRSTRTVDHVIGAHYLIRRSVFQQLGGFDERYFVYLEDLDLSYRASRLGYRAMFLAEVGAYHKGGGSSEQVKARRLYYGLRSRILYAAKHFHPVSALLVAAATLCIEPASRLLQALARRSPRRALETLKGYGYLWAWLPRYLLFRSTR
jgi:N-acetylglucosaminyl-diphospho-decaprenol L-rhamnosyltransferase